jgi:hypothetical protein
MATKYTKENGYVPLRGKETGLGYKNLNYKKPQSVVGQGIKDVVSGKALVEGVKVVGKKVLGLTDAEKNHAAVTGASTTTGRMPNGNDFRVWLRNMLGKKKSMPTSDGYMKQ